VLTPVAEQGAGHARVAHTHAQDLAINLFIYLINDINVDQILTLQKFYYMKMKPWIGQPSRGRFRTATSKRLRPSSQRRGFHRPTDAISAIRWTRNHQAWNEKSNLENNSKC
jgi:hypothetical protein